MSKRIGKIDEEELENRILISLIVLAVAIIIFIGYAWISNSVKSKTNIDQQIAESEQTNDTDDLFAENEASTEDSESASSSIGKTVDESENVSKSQEVGNVKESTNVKETETSKNSSSNTSSKNETVDTSKTDTTKIEESKQEEKQEEAEQPSFIMPVDGEIIRAYAEENLVFSNTLQEWVTHQAIDIKASSRNVVKCAAEGTVKSIKNDPRYGLTVIVEHSAGFQTVYSNLLTAEYVVEGEQVKQGQTLGTVGSSAVFEIADESHLHFEMLLNSEYVDPSLYIK